MTKRFYDVTVEYTGTKTYRVYIAEGEPAATLGYIGENYYRMDRDHNPIDEREEYALVSIITGKIEI